MPVQLRRTLEIGAIAGFLWGLIETILVYVTGTAPAREVLSILGAPLSICLAFSGSVALAHRFRQDRALDVLSEATVLLPIVALTARSRPELTGLALFFALVPLFVVAILVRSTLRTEADARRIDPIYVAILSAAYAASGLACALRSDAIGAITSPTLMTVVQLNTAVLVGSAILARLAGRMSGGAVVLSSLVASLVVAYSLRSGPPKVDPTMLVPSSSPAAPGSPNIVLVVLDTVRVDHLDLYGYGRPTFARTGAFLKDALIFDRATSNGTFSLTSHGSLFTGLLASAHGAYPLFGGEARYARLAPDVGTLADDLKRRGYSTVGLSGNDVFLSEWTGLQRGFDAFQGTGRRRVVFASTASKIRMRLLRARVFRRSRTTYAWTAPEITESALEVTAKIARPFFLFVNYFDAHDPHLLKGSPAWLDPARVTSIDAYDSQIAYIDEQLSRLLQGLKDQGELDRTLLIIAADHGEYFGDRGRLIGHPPVPYEGTTHVPLIVRLPSAIAGGRTARRTGLHEVYRMVQDVLDKKPLQWLNEIDLTPRVMTEAWARPDFAPGRPLDGRPSTTVVFRGNLKLIHRLSGVNELYDVEADPKEAKNLIDSSDRNLVTLKEAMIREVMLRKTRAPSAAPDLSEEARERLRALGYLR